MTSIAREGRSASMDEVTDLVLERFLRQFGYAAWQPLDAAAAYAEAQG
jgi:hypothetical protein